MGIVRMKSSPQQNIWSIQQALLMLLGISLLETAITSLMPAVLYKISDFTIYMLLDTLVSLAAVYLFIRGTGKGDWRDVGLKRESLFKNIVVGLVAGILIAIASLVVGNWLVKLTGLNATPQQLQALAVKAKGIGQVALLLMSGSVLVGLKEEVLYRGLLYPSMRQRAGIIRGIILTALLFALVHGDILRFVPLFLGGLVLTWLYERTGSLYASIVAHCVWNAAMTLFAIWR